MRKLFLLIVIITAFAGISSAQITVPVKKGAALPAACSPTDIQTLLFYKTGSSNGLYYCSATNTWTLTRADVSTLTTGPGSSTDNAVARFDGTTGKLIQNSAVTIADTTGAIAGSQSIALSGSTSGALTVRPPPVAGTNTLTLPAGTTDFSATGGTSQVVKQTTSGGALTVGQLAASDLSNGTTGSGNVVLKTSAALTTPDLGTPSAATLTNATGLPLTTGVTGTLPVANGGTGVTSSTGSGSNVLSNSPTLVTPALGTPSALVCTNCTGTASGLTAGNVTTNANLTGDVTSSGNATTVGKVNGVSFAGLATGILKNTTTTGAPSIAVAGDFPTLNQNTTGSAATLTTPRSIYGNNFDGSAALSGIIASTYGGTGNGFTKFSGATTSEKTYTLPNASATVLTDNAAVTVAQGGTGATTLTGILKGNGTSAVTAVTAPSGTIVGTSDTQTLTNKDLSSGTNTFPTLNQNTTGTATTATNLAGGSGGTIPYQSAAGTTAMLANGTVGQVLQSNGTTAAPSWITPSGGGNAQTANPLSQFASTTSSQLAGVISDETGTGVLMYGTSPAVTTSLTTGSSSFDLVNTTATTLNFGGAATTLNVGGTPTGAITHNYSANATSTGNTKTVNLGTGGASGSTTNVNIGSSIGGTTTVNSSTLSVTGLTTTGNVELGNASDTTLSRASAGRLAVEGVNVVTTSSTDTLTNKTLTSPIISTISNTGTLTLPTSTDTLIGKATTDTLTNKTFDTAGTGNSFSINGVAATANTGTGSVVRATSPTLVTPALGVATATTINGVTITTGTGTLVVPKVWRGTISQSGTSAPTATVMENSLGGTITWARSSQGIYTATLSSTFTSNKTWAMLASWDNGTAKVVYTSTSVITINTYSDFVGSSVEANWSNIAFEILVYP